MSDVNKLRKDVLKQATASLAAFIGEVRYSDSFHISAGRQEGDAGACSTLSWIMRPMFCMVLNI